MSAAPIDADTKAPPKSREVITAANGLPEKVDPITALTAWAATNLPENVLLTDLVKAAEKLSD